MLIDDFIAKYKDRKVDFDGSYGNQCVDLYRQYVKEVLEFPQSPGVQGAYQIFNSAQDNLYEKILNTPSDIPQKGDIIIWKKEYGGYGHVAIFVNGDVNHFRSFDQNYIGHLEPCQIVSHNYTNVLGWLRPKKQKEQFMTEERFKHAVANIYNQIWNNLNTPHQANRSSIEGEASRDCDRYNKGEEGAFNGQIHTWFFDEPNSWMRDEDCHEEEVRRQLEDEKEMCKKFRDKYASCLFDFQEIKNKCVEMELMIESLENTGIRSFNSLTGWEKVAIGLREVWDSWTNKKS